MPLLVRRAGFLTSVQDLGRSGYRASGVSLGGALDSHALRVANILVGNEDGAAGLELTLGTVRLQFDDDRLLTWCGGPFEVDIADESIPAGRAALVRAGEELTAIAPANGARAWLAISGGIDVPAVLGSRSTDLRGGFGGLDGRALCDGDILPVAAVYDRRTLSPSAVIDRRYSWSAPVEWSRPENHSRFIRVVRGSYWTNRLLEVEFTVEAESDRMGVRLRSPSPLREPTGDLLSEAVAPGTIQLPPSGQPIVLLDDCQTIGGYPKIAHVITLDFPFAAQLRPGDVVRFIEVSLEEAQRLLRQREEDVERFRVGVRLRAGWS